MMAELSPPGFDSMVRPRLPLDPYQPYLYLTPYRIGTVFRTVRSLEPYLVHDRTERDPGDH